jgi:hypothetical protein
MNSPPGKNKGNFYLKGSPAGCTQGRQGSLSLILKFTASKKFCMEQVGALKCGQLPVISKMSPLKNMPDYFWQ